MEDKQGYTLFAYLPHTSKNSLSLSLSLRPIITLAVPKTESIDRVLSGVNAIVKRVKISLSVNIINEMGDISSVDSELMLSDVGIWYYVSELNSFLSFSFNSLDAEDPNGNKIPVNVMLILREMGS